MRRTVLACFLVIIGVMHAAAANQRLVLYTSQPNTDAQQTVDAFTALHPDIHVDWVRDGTPRIIAKLRAEIEAGQPQPDVLLIADVVTMEGLKSEGKLQPYPEADISAFDTTVMDPDHSYFSTKLITTGLVYNTKAPLKPRTWQSLLDPAMQGQIIMPSPLGSGAAMIHVLSLVANLPGGWDYIGKLSSNGLLANGGNGDVLKAVAGGDKLYGMIVDYMAIREKQKGAPIEFVFPEEGTSAVTEPVAILKSAKNAEAARLFVDFLLSREGQQLEVRQGYIPARNDVALPPGYPARSSIKILGFDTKKALTEEASNRARFSDLMDR